MNTVIDKVKIFISPSLILIIGFLLSRELGRIEAKIDLISGIQIELAILKTDVERMKSDINRLELEHAEKVYGTKEDELKVK